MLKAAFHDSTYTVRTRQLGFRDVDGMGVRGTESYNNPTLPGPGTGEGGWEWEWERVTSEPRRND